MVSLRNKPQKRARVFQCEPPPSSSSSSSSSSPPPPPPPAHHSKVNAANRPTGKRRVSSHHHHHHHQTSEATSVCAHGCPTLRYTASPKVECRCWTHDTIVWQFNIFVHLAILLDRIVIEHKLIEYLDANYFWFVRD